MESTSKEKCSWCNRSFKKESSFEAGSPDISAAVNRVEEENTEALKADSIEDSILPIAPWAISSPETAESTRSDTPVSVSIQVTDGSPPMIGIRKKGATLGGFAPPARRPGGAPVPPTREKARPAGHIPAPAAPLAHTVRHAPTISSSSSAANPAFSPVAASVPVPPVSIVRPGPVMMNSPVEFSSEPMPTISMPTISPVSKNLDTSAPGLAEGVAAPSRIESTADHHAPDFGSFTATKSKYYSGAVIDPFSGAHYDADTGKVLASPGFDSKSGSLGSSNNPANVKNAARRTATNVQLNWEKPLPPMSTLLLKFTVIYAGILSVSALAAHITPSNYVLPLVVSQFLGAMLLPILRLTPWAEEDTDDLGLYILLILAGAFGILCGPVVALVIYVVISLVRQSTNPSVIGCLVVASISRVFMEIAAAGWSSAIFSPLGSSFSMKLLFISWTGLVPLAGLYAASIFRKLDE